LFRPLDSVTELLNISLPRCNQNKFININILCPNKWQLLPYIIHNFLKPKKLFKIELKSFIISCKYIVFWIIKYKMILIYISYFPEYQQNIILVTVMVLWILYKLHLKMSQIKSFTFFVNRTCFHVRPGL
jgi:hypothetical protein